MDPELSPIAVLDSDISFLQKSLALYPRSHWRRIPCVHNLVTLRWERYQLSGEKEDLDKSILHCTEAIFLPPISQATLSCDVVRPLYNLALVLLERSEKFEQPHGIKCSIKYLRYLRGLPLDSFDLSGYIVTNSLILALAIQVKSEAGDETQDIKEMVVLCRELTSNLSVGSGFPVAALMYLGGAVNAEFIRGRYIQPLDEVIECLREAMMMCPPGSHIVLFVLTNSLFIRFLETRSNNDYEEATSLLERVLDPNHSEKCPDWIRVRAPSLSATLASARSAFFQNPEYSEVSISRIRTLLGSSSIDEEDRLSLTEMLAFEARKRYFRYSLAEGLEEANSNTSQVADLSPSQSLEGSGELFIEPGSYSMTRMAEKIQHLEELLSVTPPGAGRYIEYVSDLANWYQSKFHRTNDISDIEESIKYSRLLLDATEYSSGLWRSNALVFLRGILLLAFKETSETRYLDESIAVGYDILESESAQDSHYREIMWLVYSLNTRSLLSGRTEDLLETFRLIPMAINNQYTPEPDRFEFSCQWAILARSFNHPTTLTAYESAMSSMEKSLSFAPTVSIQHARLVAMGILCQTISLDYASFQIELGRFEEAVETLEQGRALLWSEMRGLHTPMARLIEEDLPFAKRFTEITQELEALTISVTPSGRPKMGDGVGEGSDAMDPFGRLVVKRQKLVEERDVLVSQIQSRPELEGFLPVKTPSFSTLHSAASRGPVILINHCIWRSDILIIFHNSFPCTIPTTNDFYARANALRDKLVEARKHGLDSGDYQEALCCVLKDLYELVGEPVLKKLRELDVPEQTRIWWCPTSVFCSLPLHAMGPIPSIEPCERYFSDLYIPSYTPSLFALIESRKSSQQTLKQPSLLLVAQPDDTLPGVKGEIRVIRSLEPRVTVAGLVSSEATPSSVVEGLRGSHFAHFACHGVLETGKPFEASFKLHGGSRLTLLDIVRSRLPDAEFAFLSCCHAAEVTEESVADEGLHLTAAMQYCGFRSVVGTMWEMADTDGRDLAKSFYKSLFSSQETSAPYYERSAGALRDATQKLRGKRGITLERSVNFVHYGA
ncbi:CHAT domain-containing protein [Lactarius pseudohatsudake]|nr:CHAT domain-containing protein [Lactarius pseudohatsudake]